MQLSAEPDGSENACDGAGAPFAADSELLILVDAADRELGHLSKAACHDGRGVLHRAFSLLIFNDAGELLVAAARGHPSACGRFTGRTAAAAIRAAPRAWRRRPSDACTRSWDISCPLRFLFKFEYQAQFDHAGAEQELCSVYIGRCNGPIRIDRDEIRAWRWISPEALQSELAGRRRKFTPWFRLEWERIWRDHRAELARFRIGDDFGRTA